MHRAAAHELLAGLRRSTGAPAGCTCRRGAARRRAPSWPRSIAASWTDAWQRALAVLCRAHPRAVRSRPRGLRRRDAAGCASNCAPPGSAALRVLDRLEASRLRRLPRAAVARRRAIVPVARLAARVWWSCPMSRPDDSLLLLVPRRCPRASATRSSPSGTSAAPWTTRWTRRPRSLPWAPKRIPLCRRRAHAAAGLARRARRCYRGAPATDAAGRRLQPFVQQFNLPRQPFEDLIDGVEMDLDRQRYETFDELLRVLPARRVGRRPDLHRDLRLPATAAREYAVNLGVALQLTNILRDVQATSRAAASICRSRTSRGFGCTEDDLGAGARDRPRARAARVRVRARARDYYRRAAELAPTAIAGGWWRPRSCAAVYSRRSRASNERGYDVFSSRVRVPQAARRPVIALGVWCAAAEPMTAPDVIVIGAGFAGLSAAVRLAARRRARAGARGPRRRSAAAPPRLPIARPASWSTTASTSCSAATTRRSRSCATSAPIGTCGSRRGSSVDDDRSRRPTVAPDVAAAAAAAAPGRRACCDWAALGVGRSAGGAAHGGRLALRARAGQARSATARGRARRDRDAVAACATARRRGFARCCGSRWRWRRSTSRRRGGGRAPFARCWPRCSAATPRAAAIVLPTRPLRPAVRRAGARATSSDAAASVRTGAPRTAARRRATRGRRRGRRRARSWRGARRVCAVPWFALPGFDGDRPAAGRSARRRAARCAASPIVTVNLWFDRPVIDEPFVGLPGRTMQWVFDKRAAVRRRPASHLSLVSSGADDVVALDQRRADRPAHGASCSRRCPRPRARRVAPRHRRPRAARDVFARAGPAAAPGHRDAGSRACSSPATGSTPGCPLRSRAPSRAATGPRAASPDIARVRARHRTITRHDHVSRIA